MRGTPRAVLLLVLTGCGEGTATFEERIDAFLEEHDLAPQSCGAVDYGGACDTDGEAAVVCFADALEECSAVRLEVTFHSSAGDPTTSTWILWKNGANCEVASFTDHSDEPSWTDEDPVVEQVCYDAVLTEQDETCDQFAMDCYSADCEDGSDCG
jgi:hypothetical protein